MLQRLPGPVEAPVGGPEAAEAPAAEPEPAEEARVVEQVAEEVRSGHARAEEEMEEVACEHALRRRQRRRGEMHRWRR